MSTSMEDFNQQIIDEFHANEGRVGGMFERMPLLLLHHTGAKSGASRINPLAYLNDDDRYVIFASKGGAPTNPDWYHNLKAHPQVSVEIGAETVPMTARVAAADERGPIWAAQKAEFPGFADYQRMTRRKIPAISLRMAGRPPR